jgi:hypothetical protein
MEDFIFSDQTVEVSLTYFKRILLFPQHKLQHTNFGESIMVSSVAIQHHISEYLNRNDSLIWWIILTSRQFAHVEMGLM